MNFILMFLTFIYLSEISCAECPFGTGQPKAKPNADKCVTVTYDKPTNNTYYDDEGFTVDYHNGKSFVYTAFSGMVNFTNNTPQYCFHENSIKFDFNINVDSNINNKEMRAEFVTCRSGAILTDDNKFCSPPPECSVYMNQTWNNFIGDSFHVTLNMNDVNNLNVSGHIRLLSLASPSDPRVVFNITSNTSEVLETTDFLDLCSKYGPCKGGKFRKQKDLLYAKGGYPTLVMKKDARRNTVYIAVRYDPRPFVTRSKDVPCRIEENSNMSVCTSSYGFQSVKKLWETTLPYHKEWLPLYFWVTFTYDGRCNINVDDLEANEKLVIFDEPCGRYADMKRGNWPYKKFGLYTKSMQAPLRMRYRDIKIFLFSHPKFGK